MNLRNVAYQFGFVLIVLATMLGLALAVAFLHRPDTGNVAPDSLRMARMVMLLTCGFGLLAGGAMRWFGQGQSDYVGRREALLLVAISWLLGAAYAAMPYWMWASFQPDVIGHRFNSLPACYFEAMSGLTTTGATVLDDIATIPEPLLVWRSLTQWLGGLGIVVLFVAVLPSLGVGGKRLFKVEAPGPSAPGVRPRIQETARVLWLIYVGMTLAQFMLLMLAGMSWFEAINHTFTSLATGGFGTRNDSMASFSPAAQWITVVFMLLAGANFGLYYHMLRRQFSHVYHDPELRAYLLIVGLSIIVVAASIWGGTIMLTNGHAVPANAEETVRHAAFQVVSIQTTTGFATADYDIWPLTAQAVIFVLMFIGGCAGGTSGGLKVIRILIIWKILIHEFERVFRPNVVRPIRIGRSPLDSELQQGTMAYVLTIVLLFALGGLLLMVFEQENAALAEQGIGIETVTAFSASAATLFNIGPGFALVGPTQNFSAFSTPSLLVMSLLMALGRIEVFAIAVLFLPWFWKQPE